MRSSLHELRKHLKKIYFCIGGGRPFEVRKMGTMDYLYPRVRVLGSLRFGPFSVSLDKLMGGHADFR